MADIGVHEKILISFTLKPAITEASSTVLKTGYHDSIPALKESTKYNAGSNQHSRTLITGLPNPVSKRPSPIFAAVTASR